jgi:hypothetical protein
VADIIPFKPKRPVLDVHDTIVQVIDDVSSNWDRYVKVNLLNDYLLEQVALPGKEGRRLTSSLEDLAWAEEQLGMVRAIFSPGALDNPYGWVAIATFQEWQVPSPPMVSEAYARAFCLVAYSKVQRLVRIQGA